MNTKIPFILLFAASISYTSAYGCDISHFPFGASLEGVTQQLQLDLSAAERAMEPNRGMLSDKYEFSTMRGFWEVCL